MYINSLHYSTIYIGMFYKRPVDGAVIKIKEIYNDGVVRAQIYNSIFPREIKLNIAVIHCFWERW